MLQFVNQVPVVFSRLFLASLSRTLVDPKSFVMKIPDHNAKLHHRMAWVGHLPCSRLGFVLLVEEKTSFFVALHIDIGIDFDFVVGPRCITVVSEQRAVRVASCRAFKTD